MSIFAKNYHQKSLIWSVKLNAHLEVSAVAILFHLVVNLTLVKSNSIIWLTLTK
jgi:hypothetical protein